MEKVHLTLLLFCFATLALTSCGGDEEKDDFLGDDIDTETTTTDNADSGSTTTDEELQPSGSITVTDAAGDYLYDITISTAHYTLRGTDPDVLPTLTLYALFQTNGSTSEGSAFVSKNQGRISQIHISVEVDKVVTGLLTSLGTLSLHNFERDGMYYEWDTTDTYFYGDVSIIDVDPNRYLTVEFNDCQFYSNGSERLFDGTIKFPVDN